VYLNGTTTENGNVCVDFEIRDTGIGIDQRDMDDLFRPFVQLQNGPVQSTEGTGLGLSISRDLVRSMGGDISVESRLGRGSSFLFTLDFAPLPEEAATPEANTPSIPEAATGTRVLVVDDVELNRRVLTELLVHFGYTVSEAASGDEALRLAKTETFDAIVADVFMPGMDGPELARRLRKRKYRAKVLGLTAAYDDAVRMDCLAAGFDLVLAKPVSGETLHCNLSGILGTSQPELSIAKRTAPEFEPKYLDGYFETLGYASTLQMISEFRAGVDREMENLSSASAAERADLCAQALHKLGGALATVGLLKVGRSLEHLAVQLRRGGKVRVSLDKIRADLAISLDHLKVYLDGKAAAPGV
jgi:CheY-like chemotaxis protein